MAPPPLYLTRSIGGIVRSFTKGDEQKNEKNSFWFIIGFFNDIDGISRSAQTRSWRDLRSVS